MKELLRLEHVYFNAVDYPALSNYHLCVFEGTITTLYGNSGCGKEALIALLENPDMIENGVIFFEGRSIHLHKDYAEMKRKVYCHGSKERIVKSLSVLDNLLALRNVSNPFSIYQPDLYKDSLEKYLKIFNIHTQLNVIVSSLTRWEIQKLDLLKAYSSGAKLIVINFSDARYDSGNLLELKSIICYLAKQGVAFLLITDKTNEVTEISQYNQLLYRGTDFREWLSTELLSKEQKDILHNAIIQTAEMENKVHENSQIVCLYDEQWHHNMLSECKAEMNSICRTYPAFEKIFSSVPAFVKDQYRRENTVFITRNCHNKLPQNMTPADILTLGIPRRVCHFGFIQHKRIDYMYELFCRENHISATKQIHDYSATERKMLAIHRYALTKPETMIIEDPFIDLDYQGVQTIAIYLLRVLKIVPKIVILAQSIYDIPLEYNLMIMTRNGEAPTILYKDKSIQNLIETYAEQA